jgi:hypothetical protein
LSLKRYARFSDAITATSTMTRADGGYSGTNVSPVINQQFRFSEAQGYAIVFEKVRS